MKKKLNILGRKVPVLAVMMVILVIGTASAALITNYATLSGDVTVTNPVSVYDSNNALITGVDIGVLDFNSPTTFTIKNSDVVLVTVELGGSITAVGDSPIDTTGLSIAYLVDGVPISEGNQVEVPGAESGLDGESIVTVTLNAVPNVEPGTYTVQVAVNPV